MTPYPNWLRGQSAKLLCAGSTPAGVLPGELKMSAKAPTPLPKGIVKPPPPPPPPPKRFICEDITWRDLKDTLKSIFGGK